MNVHNVNKDCSEKHVIKCVLWDVKTTYVNKTLVTVIAKKIILETIAVFVNLLNMDNTATLTVQMDV
jgi:hypothetical protein